MQLTENFKSTEFKCKDGTEVPPEYMDNVQELADNLQVLRDAIGKPVYIMSGYRTVEYNERCGGAPKTQHLYAKAADIQISGMAPNDVQDEVLRLINEGKMKQGGVGIYPTFVHYDIRGTKARWGTRN